MFVSGMVPEPTRQVAEAGESRAPRSSLQPLHGFARPGHSTLATQPLHAPRLRLAQALRLPLPDAARTHIPGPPSAVPAAALSRPPCVLACRLLPEPIGEHLGRPASQAGRPRHTQSTQPGRGGNQQSPYE